MKRRQQPPDRPSRIEEEEDVQVGMRQDRTCVRILAIIKDQPYANEILTQYTTTFFFDQQLTEV
jgi:hypothetical protein